jgi:hypothetical protein
VFARITKFEGPPERVDELCYAVVERALPAARRLDGFAGAWFSPTARAARCR